MSDLLDKADTVFNLEMYPYFEITTSFIAALSVREELSEHAIFFARKHPLACWLSTMIVMFSGGLFGNFLLGEPILEAIKSPAIVTIATISWYLVFYSPYDYAYKIGKILPISLTASIMKEIYRVKSIDDGITQAANLFPDSWHIIIIVGTVRGNGVGFMKIIERLVRGVWTPNAMEIMKPAFATKASIVASILLVLSRQSDWDSKDYTIVFLFIVLFLVFYKIAAVLYDVNDPFFVIEQIFCGILFGGTLPNLDAYLRRPEIQEFTWKTG